MWLQFIGQNLHFALNLCAALVFLAIAWLYMDAWTNNRGRKEFFKWVGFGLLSVSFLAQATLIEQSVLGASIFGNATTYIIIVLRLAGYGMLLAGMVIDPLPQIPETTGIDAKEFTEKKSFWKRFRVDAPIPKNASLGPLGVAPSPEGTPEEETKSKDDVTVSTKKTDANAVFGLGIAGGVGKLLLPVGGAVVARMYWLRATRGLERHLKAVAIGFLCIAISDLIGAASIMRGTTNPVLYTWVSAFGWVWLLEQIALGVGVVFLGRWVWSYLTKRILSQLFIVFVGTTVFVFLVVSICLTVLLLRNVRTDALTNLTTAAKALQYGIAAKQSETNSGASQLAANSAIAKAIAAKDHKQLVSLTENYLSDKKQTSLLIVNNAGLVLLRGEDVEEWGDSVSSDSLVQRALQGANLSSVRTYDGINAPSIEVRSAVGVKDGSGKIIGVVVSGLELTSAFTDGIKNATGLESSLYAGNALAATTVFGSDGKTRSTGTKIRGDAVTNKVISEKTTYQGDVQIQNRQFLGVFLPLKDVDNNAVGMIMVGQPRSSALTTAGRSIEATFLIAAALLALSVMPAFVIARALEKQIH